MQVKNIQRVFYFFVPLVLLSLCVKFLNNPLIFDDEYFFSLGAPEQYFAEGFQLFPRWWVYQTMAATFVYLGSDMLWLRLGNLLAHMGAVFSFYLLARRILIDLDNKRISIISPDTTALLAAVFFAVHPLAIFTQAYLIQRTIVCATLFTLLTWYGFWRGLAGSRLALWGSCLFFGAAVFAKEHAVMVPLVSLLFMILYLRSGLTLGVSLKEVLGALLIQAVISIYVVLQLKGIIGKPYEIMSAEVLEGHSLGTLSIENLYPLSVLNQAGLYFKYLLLWLLPNPAWISIDMREAFPVDFASWSLWVGLVAFVAYVLISAALLLRGGLIGLVGLALLAPSILYFTEFASTRFQEVFVLYRSYLWMPSIFILLALGFRYLTKNLAFVLIPIFFIYFFALSFDRLTTFSHPFRVWNEAVVLLEKKPQGDNVFGAYRIYYNRGSAELEGGMIDQALIDFDRVVKIQPDFAHAYHQRGVVYFKQKEWLKAQDQFEKAISLLPTNIKSYLGLAEVLEASGQIEKARDILRATCDLGSEFACKKMLR